MHLDVLVDVGIPARDGRVQEQVSDDVVVVSRRERQVA